MNNQLYAGFARVDITPPMGISVIGYYIPRYAEGVLDNLEVNAVALKHGETTVLLIAVDNCELSMSACSEISKAITDKTGVPKEAIFIHTTHTHTGPGGTLGSEDPAEIKEMLNRYDAFLRSRCVDVAKFAIDDLKPAKMGYGVGKAPDVAFIRRFRMKDGSIMTNPGVNNPDIVAPIGEVDERVNVLRFERDNAETIVLANFGNHPDTVGGSKISGDWPTLTRSTLEKAIDNTKCIFFNGAQGDVNHVKVNPTAGDFNDMFNDFDGCSRGYGHAKHIANVVAGAIMQVYAKVNYVDVDEIKYLQKEYMMPSNKPTPEELPLAHKYNDLHNAGKDDEIPYKAMMLTTVVAEAARMVRLENAPDAFPLVFSAIKIGNVALFGIPGEPFTGVGRGIKLAKDYDLVLPCCLINGAEGYYPMKDAYDEGGYEARSSSFKSGIAERIIDAGLEMLAELKK